MLRAHRFSVLAGIALIGCIALPASAPGAQLAGKENLLASNMKVIDVAPVWTGAPVRHAATLAGSVVFVGYYDPERWLSLAVVPLDGKPARFIRLPTQFAGWDGHNYITLAVDSQGTVHVAGNMHANPLRYYQVRPPYDAKSAGPAPMIGRDETRATYPAFYHTAGDGLVFTYREGKAGGGEWHFNRWNGKAWERLETTFAESDSQGPMSAYPCVARDGNGTFHFALQWRRPGGVAKSFAITYARTRDFVRWEQLDGRPISGPISPANSSIIVNTGVEMGLRSCSTSVDDRGRPYVAYTHYSSDGPNAGYVARGENGRWTISEVTRTETQVVMRRYRTETGVRRKAIAMAPTPTTFRDGTPVACFHLRQDGKHCWELDPERLSPLRNVPLPPNATPPNATDNMDGLAAPLRNEVPVTDARGINTPAYIVWPTQRNPRLNCSVAQPPSACQPPPKVMRLAVPAQWVR